MLSFFDRMSSSSLLKLLRQAHKPKPAPSKDDDVEMEDADEPTESQSDRWTDVVRNLAHLMNSFGLRDQPDTLRAVIETMADVARSPAATGSYVGTFLVWGVFYVP